MSKFPAYIVNQLRTLRAALHRLKLRERTVFSICCFRRQNYQSLRGILLCLPHQAAADCPPGVLGFSRKNPCANTGKNIRRFCRGIRRSFCVKRRQFFVNVNSFCIQRENKAAGKNVCYRSIIAKYIQLLVRKREETVRVLQKDNTFFTDFF